MLLAMDGLLKQAQLERRAIGSFNVYNGETIRGAVQAAGKTKLPMIISFGAGYLRNMDLEEVVYLVHRLTAGEGQFVLHLDHCRDLEVIRHAIEAGFTSVMYDGSALAYEENVAHTKEVCAMAKAAGVSVEAELGSLALGAHSAEGELGDALAYTDSQRAASFAEETGVTALAVSIGTVHGLYQGTPKIRVDLLQQIRSLVDTPLVLHGGSGTPKEQLKACIQNGITKINVNTEISETVMAKTLEALEADPHLHFSRLSLLQAEWTAEVIEGYQQFFWDQKTL
mgnify:CR=1 FL=1